VFVLFFTIDRYNRWVNFEEGRFPFVQDVDQYYSYLPAAFIEHDLSFSFPNDYWTTRVDNNHFIPKVTFGMAVMYSPFFLAGHIIAHQLQYATDGYTLPYKWSIHFGSILFTMLGLWFSRKNLLKFFNEYVTCTVLICILFGTNLFYYTYGFGEMPHAYLFFIFSLFIYFVLQWYNSKKAKFLFAFSFLAGLATLIRPTECLILLFPLLLHLRTAAGLKDRMKLFLSYRYQLLLAAFLFLLPFFVQMCYWKIYAGTWLFFSYGNERFFFADPQVINFLFSFRKGWLIYTPIMLFALLGIPLLKKNGSGLFWFVLVYAVMQIYLLSSWWDWAFGGSFGCRPMVQHYAFLLFALAAFVQQIFYLFRSKPLMRVLVTTTLLSVFYFLIRLNHQQSWQYKYGLIPSDGMTKEAYFFVLGKEDFSPEDVETLGKMIKPINREEMLRGDRD
jgi:hypothetical protein